MKITTKLCLLFLVLFYTIALIRLAKWIRLIKSFLMIPNMLLVAPVKVHLCQYLQKNIEAAQPSDNGHVHFGPALLDPIPTMPPVAPLIALLGAPMRR